MPRTAFYARLFGGDAGAVADLLRQWLGDDGLTVRDRIFGTEMFYEADGLTLYCEKDDPLPDARPKYLMEGTLAAAPDAAAQRLRPLLALAADRRIDITLEYVAVDEDGQEVGDEMSLR